jgi:hypothetical protein
MQVNRSARQQRESKDAQVSIRRRGKLGREQTNHLLAESPPRGRLRFENCEVGRPFRSRRAVSIRQRRGDPLALGDLPALEQRRSPRELLRRRKLLVADAQAQNGAANNQKG